jgi:hypothetical protein
MFVNELYLESTGPFVLFPVVHHSYEFALAAAEAFRQIQPKAVAVEYPSAFEEMIQHAIARLPKISVLLYGNRVRNYIRLEPADAFVEALRLAGENGIPAHCIDLVSEDYPEIFEPLPDTYAVSRIGHKRYCSEALRGLIPGSREVDEIRERAMAFHLQQMAEAQQGPILVLCGISHLFALKQQLETIQPRPFEKPVKAKLYHLSTSSLGEVMGCFPFLTAIYELKRANSCQLDNEPSIKEEGVASALNSDSPSFQVLSGKKTEPLDSFVKRSHLEVANSATTDRNDIQTRFLLACRSYYEQEIGDVISPQQVFLLSNFSRKYANVKNMLLPDFFELLISARNCISSHFCFRMWEIGTYYPAQHGPTDLEVIELRASDIFPLIQKVRMNPHAPLKPRSSLPRFLRRSEKQRKPKEQFQFSPFSICSYQPEDIVIEDYGRYLRHKGKSILSEERKRIRPFETSLLDGIDLRETIRNWHTGKIFVQEAMTIKGSVDSLVVIYDDDDSKYPYRVTWLGEHYQESDMAFYATDPEERSVGPGIQKSVYGGFLMTMPPGRLFDVFHDPAYRYAANAHERLLLAAIDYGLEKFVLYAAPKPPKPAFQTIAGRYGKRLLYVPLSQLSPVMLQRIRTFHILADKAVRDYAKDYIW